jgi:hypothetical protein
MTPSDMAACCAIAGTFEGQIDNTDAFINIVVEASGDITISLLGEVHHISALLWW